jgi:hypothetical protein
MFLDPGFWTMIVGGLLVVIGFLGLSFSRIGDEMPTHQPALNGEHQTPLGAKNSISARLSRQESREPDDLSSTNEPATGANVRESDGSRKDNS